MIIPDSYRNDPGFARPCTRVEFPAVAAAGYQTGGSRAEVPGDLLLIAGRNYSAGLQGGEFTAA
jgi:hypothetical protein